MSFNNNQISYAELRARVKDQLIKALATPTTWRKVWKEYALNKSCNPTTGKIYKGVNPFLLELQKVSRGYSDNRWIGIGSIRNLGLTLKPGQENYPSQIYYKNVQPIVANFFGDNRHLFLKTNDSAQQASVIFDNIIKYRKKFNPSKVKEIYQDALNSDFRAAENFLIGVNKAFDTNYVMSKVRTKGKPMIFNVYNFEQLMYDPKLEDLKIEPPVQSFSLNERVEKLVGATNVPVFHDRHDECYYDPSSHKIHMTPKESFFNEHLYYSTMLHELGHATKGMPNQKLKRESSFRGSPAYAYEELCVEIASIFTCAEVGVQYDIENHAGYIQSWLTSLSSKTPEAVTKLWDAIEMAEQISEYLLTFDPERKKAFAISAKAPQIEPKETISIEVKQEVLEPSLIEIETEQPLKKIENKRKKFEDIPLIEF